MKLQQRICVITGHYGSGKTNIAVNLALQKAAEGCPVTIVDLDIVNPYFRTADFRELLEAKGITVYAPVYANTNLDIPALPPEINSVFDRSDRFVIFDVGGDDAGAIALGQYASRISAAGYEMYYIVNERRYLTRKPEDAAAVLGEIEAVSRLKATGIVNNTNLGEETTAAMVEASRPFAEAVSRLTGLPVAFTCIRRELLDTPQPDVFPMEVLVGRYFEA